MSTRYFPSATSSEKKPVPSTNELSYKIIVHPPTGVAENLIVEVSLPGVVRIKKIRFIECLDDWEFSCVICDLQSKCGTSSEIASRLNISIWAHDNYCGDRSRPIAYHNHTIDKFSRVGIGNKLPGITVSPK